MVKVSFMEIYMERIRDLLERAYAIGESMGVLTCGLVAERVNLPVHEDRSKGVRVKGLSEHYVSSPEEVYETIRRGTAMRAVSSTRMNTESSRSHSIFMFTVQQRNTENGASKSGCLYMVDLAGSEKVGKTGASGQTLEEAKKINKSLSALGMVINALTDGKSSHVPYRDSKLTRILQESLGGNSRTTLIVNCSPIAYNAEETLSTLRFGVRAKSIKNNARINAELSPIELRALVRKANAELSMYKAYVGGLETEIDAWRHGRAVPQEEWTPLIGAPASLKEGTTGAATRAIERAAIEEPMNREPIAGGHVQEQQLLQQNRSLETAMMELRWKVDELQQENRDLKEQTQIPMRSHALSEPLHTDDHGHLAHPQVRSTREQRIQDMLRALEGQHVALAPMMQSIETLLTACQQQADFPLRLDQIHALEEGLLQTYVQLSEQVLSARIAAQEVSVLQQQKLTLEKRNAAIQQRYDLITNQIGALEHSLRVGDEGAIQLAELRSMLEEQSSTSLANSSSEALHLEQLLAIRSEETAGLTRSLDDLRASHEEQRHALQLLSASIVQGEKAGPDPATVQRLVDASQQMEKARELVTLRLREYERLKEQLMQGLRERSERVVDLEMELEDMHDQYAVLLQNLQMGTQQRKMGLIERRLEQLTHVQQRLIEQNTVLKRDVALAEKRLLSRAETIEELESRLEDKQIDEWEEAADAHARIAKPLRGGGAAVSSHESEEHQSGPQARRWFFAAS